MEPPQNSSHLKRDLMTSFIQIAVVTLIVYWCFRILAPFFNIVVWGMLIAVALYPVHQKISAKIGNKPKRVAIIMALVGILGLAIPSWLIASSTISEVKALTESFEAGTLTVPAPNPKVAEWPVIGKPLFDTWTSVAADLEATVFKYKEEITEVSVTVGKIALSGLFSVLGFVFSMIIAAVFLLCANSGYKAACTLAHRVAGEQGKPLTDLAIQTIRSVTKGVLGVAIIQAFLSGLVLFIWGVPMAGILAGVVLVLAIVQLPPLLILGPIAVWVFSSADPISATIFAVLAFAISISDSFLKPMFLGKGVDVPMLVILIGAIGGAMVSGVLGLFVGSVVLAVGYKLMMAWIAMDANRIAEQSESTPE